jgi:hypothetical protein
MQASSLRRDTVQKQVSNRSLLKQNENSLQEQLPRGCTTRAALFIGPSHELRIDPTSKNNGTRMYSAQIVLEK